MTAPTIVATPHPSNEDEPLLLLGPSLGSDCAILWELVIPYLRDRYRLVSWDLPGHGRSPAMDEPFTIAELADAVAAIPGELGASSAYHAGVSIGGGTGLELALRHPDRFEKVALVCSNYRLGGDAWPTTWIERAALVRAQSTSALIIASTQRWFTPESIVAHADTVGRLLHALQDADDAAYIRCCEALAEFDREDRLPEIAVPVLNLWGDQDATISRASAEKLAATVQNGRLVVVEGAAHLATVDQPEAVARELIAFFG